MNWNKWYAEAPRQHSNFGRLKMLLTKHNNTSVYQSTNQFHKQNLKNQLKSYSNPIQVTFHQNKKDTNFTSSFPLGCFWNQLMFNCSKPNYLNKTNRIRTINPTGYIKFDDIWMIWLLINRRSTLTWAVGDGELRLSEREAMAHMRARIVTAKVSRALALYPKECIFLSFFSVLLSLSSVCVLVRRQRKMKTKTGV